MEKKESNKSRQKILLLVGIATFILVIAAVYLELGKTVTWASLQVAYRDSYDAPNSEVWTTGQVSEGWNATLENGTYCLTNTADNDPAIHYHYAGLINNEGQVQISRGIFSDRKEAQAANQAIDISERPISVDVKPDTTAPDPDPQTPNSAGLLYRFDEQTKQYYMFMLNGAGGVSFIRRDAQGATALYSGDSDALKKESFNKLAIIGKGDTFYLYINDVLIKTVRDDGLKSGVSGVIARSLGKQCFDNFTIYEDTKQPPNARG